MDLNTLVQSLALETITTIGLDAVATGAYTSDLLSDVMANAKDGNVLVTIQAHKNTVAVAALLGLPAIILCNNRPVAADMSQAAESEGVALLRTRDDQYTTSGRLFALFANQ